MSKVQKLIAAIVVVGLIVFGAFLFMDKSDTSQSDNSTNTTTNNNQNAAADVTITYDGNSFSLTATSVKAGGTVKIVNDSQKALDFNSDPHPVHTDNPQLNAGDIPVGESKTLTLTTKGTWKFHNHLDASQRGELTVE